MISRITFDIFKFENWPPPVGTKTQMHFHVSLGFLGNTLEWSRVNGLCMFNQNSSNAIALFDLLSF